MENGEMVVQLATPERLFVKVYKDFLATKFLSTEEKMIYIALKSFVDFKNDEGQVYPSMDTLCELTSMSRPRATRAITGLIKKGIVIKKRRGLTKSNIYILKDSPSIWKSNSVEEMQEIAESRLPYTDQELLEEVRRRKLLDKIEKELTSDTAQSTDVSTFINSQPYNNKKLEESQEESTAERYSLEKLKVYFEYEYLQKVAPHDPLVDTVIQLIYDTVNTTAPTIRVQKQDRPREVVISQLLKLKPDEILFVLDNFKNVSDTINNTKAYLLTQLYNAKSQMSAETANQVVVDQNK